MSSDDMAILQSDTTSRKIVCRDIVID